MVLLHPHGVEAELLGARDLVQRLLVVVAALDGDEADLQSAPCRPLSYTARRATLPLHRRVAMPVIAGFETLKHLPEEKISDQISRRVLVGRQEHDRLVVDEGGRARGRAPAPERAGLLGHVRSMDIRIGTDRRVCKAGDIGVIPGGVEHEAWFPTDCEVIDVFAPRREDFLTAEAPAYMRQG